MFVQHKLLYLQQTCVLVKGWKKVRNIARDVDVVKYSVKQYNLIRDIIKFNITCYFVILSTNIMKMYTKFHILKVK